MKKSLVTILVILGIIIVGAIIYFSFSKNSGNSGDESNIKLNSEDATEFYEFAQEIKANYFPEITIEKVEVENLGGGRIQGSVELGCDTLSAEEKQEVIESFANLLYSEYPEHFGENAIYDSWTDISCSNGGWRIAEGVAQPLLY